MGLLLGAVADDFTGATDLCNTLVREGMATILLIGVPQGDVDLGDAQAAVVALKSRTAPVGQAVKQSLAAAAWLRERGARQLLFKYCSTFDSTAEGNIGPVADALLGTMQDVAPEGRLAIVCPAFPATGRTIYQGHLFVGDRLLSDTHMANHPLTPMTDSNLVRVMAAQTQHGVGLIDRAVVARGHRAVATRIDELRAAGVTYAIADAIADSDLRVLGEAASGHGLITGGSGIALGLPANHGLKPGDAPALPAVNGLEVVLAGSCSAATLAQIEAFGQRHPTLALDPIKLADGFDPASTLAWAAQHMASGPVLIYASAPPAEVARIQARLGRERAGALVEDALAALAPRLVDMGVRRFVAAGGETSGAVVQALGISGLHIGEQIDPGVPACVSIDRPGLALALKSGNFGATDFFTKAFSFMPGYRPLA